MEYASALFIVAIIVSFVSLFYAFRDYGERSKKIEKYKAEAPKIKVGAPPEVSVEDVILALGDSDEWVRSFEIQDRLNKMKKVSSGSAGVTMTDIFMVVPSLERNGLLETNRNESGEYLLEYRLTQKGLSNFESLLSMAISKVE